MQQFRPTPRQTCVDQICVDMHPTRISVCTYNIWTTTRWPERRDALASFAQSVHPDILCLQEVQPDSLRTLDQSLPCHQRIDDDFEGWSTEGNIYWRNDLFQVEAYGCDDIGIFEPLRRLFWVRLRLRHSPGKTVHVATAHYTWHGHEFARSTERNVRIAQARATAGSLDVHRRPGEAQLFMGDLNDSTEPIRLLHEAGFVDCFSSLGQTPAITHPAGPNPSNAPCTLDWILSRGPIRSVVAHVVDFFHGDLTPSDHKPVVAVFEL
jgi:endonuclease/exonuclease/phosphatase family metal-dependent hydrolase